MAGLLCCGYGAFDEGAAAAATTSRMNARERERRSGRGQTGPVGPARPSLFFRGCLSPGLTGVCGVWSLQRFFFIISIYIYIY
jgi:hypothetical protein